MSRLKLPSLPRLISAVAVAGAAALGAAGAARALLPAEGALAAGLRVGGEPVVEGQSAQAVAQDRAARALDRKVTFRWGEKAALTASVGELGGEVDEAAVAREVAAIARRGDLLDDVLEALEARAGRVDVRVPVSFGVERLAEKLERFKEENDAPPVDARLNIAARTATDDAPGRYVDVYGAAAALDQALFEGREGDLTIDMPAFKIEPRASKEAVLAIDVGQVVSRFETKFGYLGGQANRAGNIARAASQMDGVVLMPGEIVSFNEHVGPRSTDNGFFPAPEIYKGEMREGIGGGTCQVAGTLHAAAFFGGLDIVERSPHSRPSGYIRMGLDATVVYPTTDLKLRNAYDFPVVIHATFDKGTLVFELYGQAKPVKVELATETVGMSPYKRKIEEAPWLAEGKFVLKQKGITGHTIRKRRVMHFTSGEERVEVTTDVYPATFEIYQIAPGTDLSTLPPPPEGAEGTPAAAAAAPPTQVAAADHPPTSG